MRYLPSALRQLEAGDAGKTAVNDHYVIVLVARKLSKRAIAIRAQIDFPLLRGQSAPHGVGDLDFIFNVQDADVGRRAPGVGVAKLVLCPARCREQVTSTWSHRRALDEQVAMPAID